MAPGETDDDDDPAVLKTRIRELERELEMQGARIRAQMVDQYESWYQDRAFLLEQEAARLREDVTQLKRHTESLRALIPQSGQICVRPLYPATALDAPRLTSVFLIMPFRKSWSVRVEEVLKKTLKAYGLACTRADRLQGHSVILSIWAGICEAGLVIADISECTPNVMYEVGLADVLGKSMILLAQTTKVDDVPFDLVDRRRVEYAVDDAKDLEEKIRHQIGIFRQEIGGRVGGRYSHG